MKNLSPAEVFASCTRLSSAPEEDHRTLTHSGFTESLELLQGKTLWAQGLNSLDSSVPVHYCLPAASGMCEVTLLYSLFVWLCAVYHLSKTIGVPNTCATEPRQSL